MVNKLKEKIAIKLAIIIASVVTISIFFFLLYLNNINTQEKYKSLESNVFITSGLLKVAYEFPLWGFAYDELERLNKGILETPAFIAINVFNTKKFISGFKKEYKDSDFIKLKTEKPYTLPEDNIWIHKKTEEIIYENEVIGYFELFFTDA